MPSWITALLTFLLGLWKQRGPSQQTVEAERAGAAVQSAQASQEAVKAEQRIAQAEVDAPKTQAEIEDRLGKGTF